jgi:uncharacterized protein YjdB
MVRWIGPIGIGILAAFAFACSNSTTAPTTVSSVTVTGTVPTMGATSQFTARATLSDGTTQDVTGQATWQSSDSTVATVSATGSVTAIAAGTVNVMATYQTISGSDQITVAP